MINPLHYDIVIFKGATFDQPFTWKDNSGNIYDLSAFTAKMQVRVEPSSPDPAILTLQTGSGITLSNISPNIKLYVSASDTAAVTISTGVYDLELTDPSDDTVIRLIQGRVKFIPEVTR